MNVIQVALGLGALYMLGEAAKAAKVIENAGKNTGIVPETPLGGISRPTTSATTTVPGTTPPASTVNPGPPQLPQDGWSMPDGSPGDVSTASNPPVPSVEPPLSASSSATPPGAGPASQISSRIQQILDIANRPATVQMTPPYVPEQPQPLFATPDVGERPSNVGGPASQVLSRVNDILSRLSGANTAAPLATAPSAGKTTSNSAPILDLERNSKGGYSKTGAKY